MSAQKGWEYVLVVLLLILSVALGVLLINQSTNFLVTNLISDDAFYYFLIAKNVLAGNGPTVDGVNPANGFHPLWLTILLPFFSFFKSGLMPDFGPIQAVLVFSALLQVATGVILYRIVARYTMNKWLRLTALALWLFNPFVIYESLSGLETPLSLFLIALLVYLGVRLKELPRVWLYGLAGIVGGLMMLARLDNIFYFLLFLAWILVTHDRDRYKKVILVGILATLVVLPWLVWNLNSFGMLVPASAQSSTMVNHRLVTLDNGPGLLQALKAAVFFSYIGLQQVITETGMRILLLIMAGLFLGGWIFERQLMNPGPIRRWGVELFMFLGFILHFAVSATFRWTFRSWYFMPFNFFLALFAAWFLARIAVKIPYQKWAIGIFAVLMLGSFYISWSRNLQNQMGNQAEMAAAAEWANENLPQGTVLGSFNSGTIGYFSDHQVVNLDGLVNNNAFSAMRNDQLFDYIKKEKIEYIVDFPVYLTYRYQSFWGIPDPLAVLEPTHVITLASNDPLRTGITVYKLK